MSRSGYSDGFCESREDQWAQLRWRGAVASSIRGQRGQEFLRDMLAALDAMPERKLEADVLVESGKCCAMGAVAMARGLDTTTVDPDNREEVAALFGIAPALAAEIAWENDESCSTPESRWLYMRAWVVARIKPKVADV